MEFMQFNQALQRHMAHMLECATHLYVADVDQDALWEMYLASFPEGTNEVFRQRRYYDCSCCRHFVRSFGNVVTIKDNQVVTIWDFDTNSTTFQPVVDALSEVVGAAFVKDQFITKQAAFGTPLSHELMDGVAHTWHHLSLTLPPAFVTRSRKSEAELRGEARDSRNVFQRSLQEISRGAIETVLDLIAEGTLYRGEEWRAVLEQFLALHDGYHALPTVQKDNYCWTKSAEAGGALARIRNHSIGTLLTNISQNMDVEVAVRKYEIIMAPSNYKRPKPIFTKSMVEDAERTVVELGLFDSLGRRHATLADITVNNVLWSNRDAAKIMGGVGGVFAALKQEVEVNARQFERAPGMGIADFIANVLPTASNIEVLLCNQHERNLVSLIAPITPNSPSMFKWGNPFSWAYNGNIADSDIARNVRAAGGKTDGALRCSLQWNDGQAHERDDLDAHLLLPNGVGIYYAQPKDTWSGGELDVDIINPLAGKPAVENITLPNRVRMYQGTYNFFVRNYTRRTGTDGFRAEVAFDDRVYRFDYRKPLLHKENVAVAAIHLDQNGFSITEHLPSTTAANSRAVWGLKTNGWHRVSSVMYSPNYWDGQGVGNRHYFFFLAGCVNPSTPNGFYNEFLKEEFTPHRKVFEALGDKMKVVPSDDQLSGIGFSSTQRAALIVKVDNNRVVKIIF